MILKSGSCLSLRPLSPFRLSLLVYSPAPFWVEYRVKMFRVKFTIPTGIFLCVKWSLKTGFAYKFWRFRWTKECVGEDFVFFADRAAGSGRSKEGKGEFLSVHSQIGRPVLSNTLPGSEWTGQPQNRSPPPKKAREYIDHPVFSRGQWGGREVGMGVVDKFIHMYS